MADVAFVAIIVVFFALAALFVRACDRMIGSEDEAFADAPEYAGTDSEQIAA